MRWRSVHGRHPASKVARSDKTQHAQDGRAHSSPMHRPGILFFVASKRVSFLAPQSPFYKLDEVSGWVSGWVGE